MIRIESPEAAADQLIALGMDHGQTRALAALIHGNRFWDPFIARWNDRRRESDFIILSPRREKVLTDFGAQIATWSKLGVTAFCLQIRPSDSAPEIESLRRIAEGCRIPLVLLFDPVAFGPLFGTGKKEAA